MEDVGKDLSVKSLNIADEKIPEVSQPTFMASVNLNDSCNMRTIQVSGRPPAEITEIAEETVVAVETADPEQEAECEVRIDSFYFS